jgi:hypothetical protein
MNKHILVDRLSVYIASLMTGKRKFFSKNLQAHSFEEHLHRIDLRVPELIQEGEFELKVSTFSGELDPAIKVVQWLGYDYPIIIYHHGNNERPFDFSDNAKNTFFQIFMRWPRRIPANLILVRAPFHNGKLRHYQDKMTELNNFMAMLAVSVRVIEGIVKQFRRRSQKAVLITGISLGGWVTNLHRAYFNTAQAYIPIMAGAKLGEVFVSSPYRKLSGKNVLKNPERVREKLNFFNTFRKVTSSNLFPLLARHDQYIEYYIQKPAYNGFPLRTIDTGHITGVMQPYLSREHILEVLQMHS